MQKAYYTNLHFFGSFIFKISRFSLPVGGKVCQRSLKLNLKKINNIIVIIKFNCNFQVEAEGGL